MTRTLTQILADFEAHTAAGSALVAEVRALLDAHHATFFGDHAPASAPVHAPAPAPAPPQVSPPAPSESVSAVENVRALVAAGIAHPGARGLDGRLAISQYGGPTDRTPDAGTEAGLGNRGNKLTACSIALSPDLIHELAVHGGELVSLEVGGRVWPLGVYDDSTAARIIFTIDVYDPGDQLGRDTFLAVVPAGAWTLRAGSRSASGPATAPAPAPTPPPAAGLTRATVLERAHSLADQPITYELGKQPPGPASDCSGFVDWCNGIDRAATGENTDAMVADANGPQRYYKRVDGPAHPGDAYVYPSPGAGHYGHTGVISAVDAVGVPTRVIHCSSGNTPGRAIQETDPHVFSSHNATIIVRAVALVD